MDLRIHGRRVMVEMSLGVSIINEPGFETSHVEQEECVHPARGSLPTSSRVLLLQRSPSATSDNLERWSLTDQYARAHDWELAGLINLGRKRAGPACHDSPIRPSWPWPLCTTYDPLFFPPFPRWCSAHIADLQQRGQSKQRRGRY